MFLNYPVDIGIKILIVGMYISNYQSRWHNNNIIIIIIIIIIIAMVTVIVMSLHGMVLNSAQGQLYLYFHYWY